MAKMFGELPQNIVQKEPTSPYPRKSEEIRPFFAELDRKETLKRSGSEVGQKNFTVWMLRTAVTQNDPGVDATDQAIHQSIRGTNTNGTMEDRRLTSIQTFSQSELRHILPTTFEGYGHVNANALPDLVIVNGDYGYDDSVPEGQLTWAYLANETQPIRDIRHAADSTMFHFFPSGERLDSDWDTEFFHNHILNDTAYASQIEKREVTREQSLRAIASSLFNFDTNWEYTAKAFDEYARTGDEHALHRIVTHGRIRKSIATNSQHFDRYAIPEHAYSKKDFPEELKFSTNEEYTDHMIALAKAVYNLSREIDTEALREDVYRTLKQIIDERKDEYYKITEHDALERRLIQPLILSVGKSEKYRDACLEAGADATLTELSPEDTEQLIALANRIRTSPASVMPDRLRRNKSEFYRSVVDQIEDQSKESPDTEKELQFLLSLFKRAGAQKILDVGCGYGRLAKPLAKKGFDVTGIDASRELLMRAKELKGKTKNLHYAKGDIIDYRESIPKGSFDAVYYGWHSFLEAYGLGNSLSSLQSARHALKPGGVIAFDQPSRTNPGLEDGWYGDAEHGYLAYLMDEEEIKFMLRLAGFEDVSILHWTSKGSTLYPEGMQKITVVARKPSIPQQTEELREVT